MNDHDFNELAGRIEGLSRLVLNVTAMLEEVCTLLMALSYAPRCAAVAQRYRTVGRMWPQRWRTLAQLAEQLDYARNSRQSRGDRGESQGR